MIVLAPTTVVRRFPLCSFPLFLGFKVDDRGSETGQRFIGGHLFIEGGLQQRCGIF